MVLDKVPQIIRVFDYPRGLNLLMMSRDIYTSMPNGG